MLLGRTFVCNLKRIGGEWQGIIFLSWKYFMTYYLKTCAPSHAEIIPNLQRPSHGKIWRLGRLSIIPSYKDGGDDSRVCGAVSSCNVWNCLLLYIRSK